MISSKNVGDLEDYELVAAYARGNQKKITKSKAKTLEEALEQTVREVPGSVFLMNAKIYMIKKKYFAIEGDVWGLKQNANYKGFKVGDYVMWKTVTGYKKGTVEAIKNSEECVVIEDGSMHRTTIKFVKLMRADGAGQGYSYTINANILNSGNNSSYTTNAHFATSQTGSTWSSNYINSMPALTMSDSGTLFFRVLPVTSGEIGTYQLHFSISRTTGIQDNELASIILYPNPVTDRLIINGSDEIQLDGIEIYDISGRLIQTVEKDCWMINTSHLSKGTYLLRLLTSEGEIIRKFLK